MKPAAVPVVIVAPPTPVVGTYVLLRLAIRTSVRQGAFGTPNGLRHAQRAGDAPSGPRARTAERRSGPLPRTVLSPAVRYAAPGTESQTGLAAATARSEG